MKHYKNNQDELNDLLSKVKIKNDRSSVSSAVDAVTKDAVLKHIAQLPEKQKQAMYAAIKLLKGVVNEIQKHDIKNYYQEYTQLLLEAEPNARHSIALCLIAAGANLTGVLIACSSLQNKR